MRFAERQSLPSLLVRENMNTGQKIVLAFALLGIVASGLVPGQRWPAAQQVEYAFLFDPPKGANPLLCSVSLDVSVLLTVWVVILAISFCLVLLIGLRRTP